MFFAASQIAALNTNTLFALPNLSGIVLSGYPKVDIEMGFIFKTYAPESFLDYLTEKVATNHIDHSKYNDGVFRAWYEYKDVENAEKWLSGYYIFQKDNKASAQVI